MAIVDGMKHCTKCKENRPCTDFSKADAYPDGLKSWCKKCCNDYCRKYRERPGYKERHREKARAWARRYRERYRAERAAAGNPVRPYTRRNAK